MRVGFTGSRMGMTERQYSTLIRLLTELRPVELHHGDCIGSDEEVHKLAKLHFHCRIVLHPPLNPSKRAWCTAFVSREPRTYLIRNKDIVNETDALIAIPRGESEEIRSGTWATVRYARSCNKPVYVIYASGNLMLPEYP